MYDDLPEGWMSDEELAELQNLAAGKTVLEIGTWKGRSACAMAQAGAEVYCLDTFQGDASTGKEWVLPDFLANAQRLGLLDRLHPLASRWEVLLPFLDLSPFGLLFYDAAHDEASTYEAGRLLLQRAGPNVPVAFHDFLGWHSVKLAVDRLTELSGRRLRLAGTIAILESR
jgi:hypothetical protein